MPDLSAIWDAAKFAANGLASVGFVGYAVKEVRKKFLKPVLAARLTVTSRVLIRYGKDIERTETQEIHTPNGLMEIEQTCLLALTNNTEHIAFKLRLVKADNIEFSPELDFTKPIMAHQTVESNVVISTVIPRLSHEHPDEYRSRERFPFDELKFEYRNASGRKYHLIFRPNEKDVSDRNTCVKA
ncbi:hypothetical protein [Hymenobacter armeniacus]|uniref:Uncharacterized protein n=1 Tax=Hymenobacter armeniacus TaxID=2771358 RepID=A0ABR8JPU8_9BACT|nr:hypothetical protein [Hymenobacter armeniacus]MBD2720811.1 hypothetical protein [Hymenobacter armeniacus]